LKKEFKLFENPTDSPRMEKNTSSHGTPTSSITGFAGTPTTSQPTPNTHRAWRRVAGTLATLSTAAFLVGDVPSAGASTPVRVTTVASPATSVGFGIRATMNVMDTVATPTGSATFQLFGPSDPTCSSPIFSATVGVAGTSAVSPSFIADHAGSYRWTTSYSGDANHAAAGPTACSYEAADVTVAKARTTLRIATTATGPLTFAFATLSGVSPTGTVTFVLTGPNDTFCTSTPVHTSTVAVNAAGTYLSGGFTALLPGTYRWRASYSGDSDNLATSMTGCIVPGNAEVLS